MDKRYHQTYCRSISWLSICSTRFFCLVTVVQGVYSTTQFLQPLCTNIADIISWILPFSDRWIHSALTISDFHYSAVVGGIGLGLAVIPIIFTISEDALSAVPNSYREASLALGATESETAFKVMLPAALPGVVAAILLGIGRAFGETMIALMATGNAALFSWNIFHPVRTLAATIGSETGEVQWGSLHYNILFFLGILLFLVSFIINALTELFVKKYLSKNSKEHNHDRIIASKKHSSYYYIKSKLSTGLPLFLLCFLYS